MHQTIQLSVLAGCSSEVLWASLGRMNRPVLAVFLICFAVLLDAGGRCSDISEPGTSTPTQEKRPEASRRVPEVRYSADGAKVAFVAIRDGDSCSRVYVSNSDGSGLRAISSRKATASDPFFFPEGNRLVYSEATCPQVAAAFPRSNLFVANTDGTHRLQLTSTGGYNGEATVSPDGQTIAFVSTRDGNPAIYTMSVDSRKLERLTTGHSHEGVPLFSPDGKWIAFYASRPFENNRRARGDSELWVMRVDGSSKRQLTTDNAGLAPYFSEDGQRIVFASAFRGAQGTRLIDLFAADLNGADVTRLTHNFESPQEITREKELQENFIRSTRNRERLRESTPFGILKALAYVFIALSLLLILVWTAYMGIPALRSAISRTEQLLMRHGILLPDSLRTGIRRPSTATRPASGRRSRRNAETLHKP